MEKLIELIKSYPIGGKQIHGANIVATMLANGINTILTQNTDDYERFADIISVLTIQSEK